MNATTTGRDETRLRTAKPRCACLFATSLALLTSALGATLLQAVLGTQGVA